MTRPLDETFAAVLTELLKEGTLRRACDEPVPTTKASRDAMMADAIWLLALFGVPKFTAITDRRDTFLCGIAVGIMSTYEPLPRELILRLRNGRRA